MPDTFSGTRLGAWYFIAQGLAVAAWWVWLAISPSSRALFIPPGAAEADLLAFRLPDLLVVVPASLMAGAALLAGARWAVPIAWTSAGAIVYSFGYCVAWAMLRQGGWLNVAMMAPAALLSTVSAIDASVATFSIFRRAAAAPAGRHIFATLIQITLFWSFFLVVVPAVIVYVEVRLPWPPLAFDPSRTASVLLFAAFSILGLWSGITMAARGAGTPLPFDSPNRLVTTGPYALVRNPMVIAGLGQGASVGLWFGSWAVLAYVALGGLIWQLLVRPAEERDLHATFGEPFGDYCREVGCWIPKRGRARRLKRRLAGLKRWFDARSRPTGGQNARRLRERGESLDTIVFRDAVPADIPALADLHVTTWNATYRTTRGPTVATRIWQWNEVFAKPNRRDFVLVLEDRNGRLIGFTWGKPQEGEFQGQLSKIYLRWEYHGLGLGRRMMAETARRFLDRGIESFILFAELSNPTLGFYDRMGGERLTDDRGLFSGAYAWRDAAALLEGP